MTAHQGLPKAFVYAWELKKIFDVWGHFYRVDDASADCRSTLEIIRKDSSKESLVPTSREVPDALFIMMNPGSSRPLNGKFIPIAINSKRIQDIETSLVPTRPDNTQYQLMRVMARLGWNHVRVLNLSDLRNSVGADFVEQMKAVEKGPLGTAHSIFSDARQSELAEKLQRKAGGPLVYAWGKNPGLQPLIEQCLSKVGNEDLIFGLRSHDFYYAHPLPRPYAAMCQWVDALEMQLKNPS